MPPVRQMRRLKINAIARAYFMDRLPADCPQSRQIRRGVTRARLNRRCARTPRPIPRPGACEARSILASIASNSAATVPVRRAIGLRS